MWNLQIAGEDFYHIINWFIIYSFLGWIWESIYVSVRQKKLVNRGFVTGPVCTIYGFGAVIVYLILKPVSYNFGLLVLGGIVAPTLLEYATAVVMESTFHTRWWDYSKNKYNFQGRICLSASIGWGVFSVLLFKVLHPFVENIMALYSVETGKIAVMVIGVLYLIDFGASFASAMQIAEKLRNMDNVMDELYEYIQSTRLYESTEELRERLDLSRWTEFVAELKNKMEIRLEAVIALGTELSFTERKIQLDEYKMQIEEKISRLHERYEQSSRKGNFFIRRMMRAYPNMKTTAEAFKNKAKRKINK